MAGLVGAGLVGSVVARVSGIERCRSIQQFESAIRTRVGPDTCRAALARAAARHSSRHTGEAATSPAPDATPGSGKPTTHAAVNEVEL